MNNIMNIGGVDCYEENGTAYLKLEAVARGLGFTTTQNVGGTEYVNVRWKRVEEYLEEIGFATSGKRPEFIPENIFYRLAMKAKNETAEKFQTLVADEIIPTIRRTGGYVNNDEQFINTYLPFADDNIKLLFATTLQTIREQNAAIQRQKTELKNKQEVIDGLVDDIDVYTKKDIINRTCRRTGFGYAKRYKNLYKCFKETFHIDLEARCAGYNSSQVVKRKDKLSVLNYADKFGFIDDLYVCCVKLYETDVKELLEYLQKVHA